MLVKLKGIHKVKRKLADGSTQTYYYAWRGGPRMKSKPHTEAFAREYARLKESAAPAATLETLIERLKGEDGRNPDWLGMAESTRRDHEYAFKLITKEWSNLPLRFTQQMGMKSDIRRWHRSFATNPRKADKLLFSLSKLFSYGIALELIKDNPCRDIERLYSGSRREAIWTPDRIATFRAGAKPHILLPFEIAIGTGQRQGDILALPWKSYDGVYLKFEHSKSRKGEGAGKRVKVRVHSRLKAMLDAMPKDALRICLNSRGRPWTTDGFKSSWGKECDRLGIDDVTFHDLRGTFITSRVREGSSIEDVARITGHTTGEVKTVLERHYLASDQSASDAVILRMEKNA